MRLEIACLVALLASTNAVLAVEASTYTGTLGKLPIIVELAAPDADGKFVGRYAYLAKGGDIPLHGQKAAKDGDLALQEEKPCTDALCKTGDDLVTTAPMAANWALKAEKQGLVGTWSDIKTGKTLPVTLTFKATRQLPENETGLEAIDPTFAQAAGDPPVLSAAQLPYDFLKLTSQLKPGAVKTAGDNAYRMDNDKRAGIAYPVVVKLRGADPAPLNAYLLQQRLQLTLPAFSCMAAAYLGFGWGGFGGQGTSGYEEGPKVSVEYFSTRLIEVSESGMYFCGGPHPDSFQSYQLFDVRTGKPLVAEQLLAGWVATDTDGAIVDPKTVKDPSTLTFGPNDKLKAFITTHLDKDIDEGTKNDCGYDNLISSNLGVYFTRDNMVFTFKDLPNVSFACTVDLVKIPLKDARPLLTDEGAKYFKVLDR
jgi:hypothetical protein